MFGMCIRAVAASALLSAAFFVAGSSLLAAAQAPAKELPRPVRRLNEHFPAVWAGQKLQPSALTSDTQFLRRATLDIIGRIATVDEVRAFERDESPDKRRRLIDRLLASEEYASFWADVWAELLLTRSAQPHPVYHEQLRRWLQEQFARNISHKELADKLLTARGKSDENPAVHFLLALLGEPIPEAKWKDEGQFDMAPITHRSAQLFLGIQLQCVQCHDHPYTPDWKQTHFWRMNVFFRQLERQQHAAAAAGDPPVLELTDNPAFNASGLIRYERRNGVVLPSGGIYLDGQRLPVTEKDRRKALARFMTSDVQFARAAVNRMWGHFFGRGLNLRREFDDFGEHNAVLHPQLLEELAKDFIESGFDTKQLIRWICQSRPYQLQSVPNDSNRGADQEPYFSRLPVKPLSLTQLFNSLELLLPPSPAEHRKVRERWRQACIVDVRADKLSEADFIDHVVDPQLVALFLMNSRDINESIARSPSVTLARTLAERDPTRAVEHLYLTVLNRRPSAKEADLLLAEVARTAKDARAGLWQDIFWALLNSSEFGKNR